MVRKCRFEKLYYVIVLIVYKLLDRTGTNSVCDVRTINNKLTADCSDRNIAEVPTNLSHDIQVLDLSKNFLMNFSADSLKNYASLIELKIEQLKFRGSVASIHSETFLSLKKLQVVLLNDSKLFGIQMLEWPSNLRVLNVDENNLLGDVRLTNLNKLENLSIELNELIDLPVINESAPLKILHAGGNPMENLTVESLSPYCLLESIQLDLEKRAKTRLNTSDKYCQCVRIEKFLAKIKLRGNVRLGCMKRNGSSNCNFNFTETAKNRNKCLKRHQRIGNKNEMDYIKEFSGVGDVGEGSGDSENGSKDDNPQPSSKPDEGRGIFYWLWRIFLSSFFLYLAIRIVHKCYNRFIKAKPAPSIEMEEEMVE